MKREALLALAAGFREANPKLAEHGFVTIYKGTVTGWKRTLNRPGTEVPGAYAVGADASIFRACGGDEEHGAHAFLLATGECLHADDESSECSQACSECSEHRSNDCGASIQANGLDNASSR